MNNSILIEIKKLLGLTEDYEVFDTDIIIGINSAIATLRQIGIGPTEGFSVEDKYTSWSDYLGDAEKLHQVKTFIYLKTKTLFDPPQGSVQTAYDAMADEILWRLKEVHNE